MDWSKFLLIFGIFGLFGSTIWMFLNDLIAVAVKVPIIIWWLSVLMLAISAGLE